MKTAWHIIAIVAVLNLLVLLGFVAWLHQSQRLSRARVDAIIALLKPTFEEESARLEEERKNEEAAQVEQEKIAHLREAAQGPVTLIDRLEADQQADELALHKLARLQTEIADLHRGLAMQNRQLAQERQQLMDERQAFEDAIAQRQSLWASEDFQRVVETLEQIKPAQAKQMMQELITLGRDDQAVTYLAAMDIRKSAAVIREFKTPQEIAIVTRLMEQIRQRRHETAAGRMANSMPGSQG